MIENQEITPEEIKTLKDILNLGRALISSLTSSQVVSLASSLGEIVQTLNRPGMWRLMTILGKSSDNLADLLELIDAYHRSGAIKNGLELITLLGVVRDALSTHTVAKLAEDTNTAMVAGDQLVSAVGGIAGIQKLAGSVVEASKEAAQDSSTVGVIGLLRNLKEPQLQKGIKFLFHLAKRLDQNN